MGEEKVRGRKVTDTSLYLTLYLSITVERIVISSGIAKRATINKIYTEIKKELFLWIRKFFRVVKNF